MCVGMGAPVHALQQDVALLQHVQVYAITLALVLAQTVVVLQDVVLFLVILDVPTPVQEIAVPQTAQLKVVHQALDAIAYAQMHVLDAEQHVRVVAPQVTNVVVVVIQGVQAAITNVLELVHQCVIEHVLLHHVSQRLVGIIV